MNASVKIAFDVPTPEAVMPQTISGGIRIEVRGVEVTRDVGQDIFGQKDNGEIWWYDYTGNPLDANELDYKGYGSIETTLWEFAKNILQIARGDVGRFEQLHSPVMDTSNDLLLSCIDNERDLIRVAYQDSHSPVGTELSATIESAIGYAVPLSSISSEVARCLREYVDYAVSGGEFDRADTRFQEILDDAAALEN